MNRLQPSQVQIDLYLLNQFTFFNFPLHFFSIPREKLFSWSVSQYHLLLHEAIKISVSCLLAQWLLLLWDFLKFIYFFYAQSLKTSQICKAYWFSGNTIAFLAAIALGLMTYLINLMVNQWRIVQIFSGYSLIEKYYGGDVDTWSVFWVLSRTQWVHIY